MSTPSALTSLAALCFLASFGFLPPPCLFLLHLQYSFLGLPPIHSPLSSIVSAPFLAASRTPPPLVTSPCHAVQVRRWGYCVLDEAHRLKNREAKALAALKTLNCPVKLALTGTPLQNNVGELWTLLNLLDPLRFDDADSFLGQYGDMHSATQARGSMSEGCALNTVCRQASGPFCVASSDRRLIGWCRGPMIRCTLLQNCCVPTCSVGLRRTSISGCYPWWRRFFPLRSPTSKSDATVRS